MSGLGRAAIKTLKEKYLPEIRQANAALEWLPGTDDVKEAASRWASQADEGGGVVRTSNSSSSFRIPRR